MALQLRYQGEFLSRAGVTWRVDILQENAFPYEEVGELTFDAEQAVVFEWSNSKTDTIWGSTATIKIQSPSDRQYVDLYTIEVGQIRMDVYREGELYWRGMLDPEFYEEPYEMLQGYTVTLTFSDFGILERLVFNREAEGMSNLQDLVQECLDRAGLEYGTWANRYENGDVVETISTDLADTLEGHLKDYSVRNANFYDEEGEASTLSEVLEGILQPLAIHIKQHDGRVYIFDYQWLSRTDPVALTWDGATQTLGVDSVYNNVKVTWSPYAQNIEFSDEVWTTDIDEDLCPYEQLEPMEDNGVYCFGYDFSDGCVTVDAEEEVLNKGFSLWVDNGNVHSSVAPFKVVPFYKGEDCEGYALRWSKCTYNESKETFTWVEPAWGFTDARLSGAYSYSTSGTIIHDVVIESEKLSVPVLNEPSKFALLLSMDVQINATTTPWHDLEPEIEERYFHESDWGKDDISTPSDWLKTIIRYILVPVNIYFDTDDGERYVWQNMDVDYGWYDSSSGAHRPNIERTFAYSWQESLGTWVKAESGQTLHQAYLAYYSTNDPTTGNPACLGSWGANNHFCGLTPSPLAEATKIDGQCVAYPNIGKAGKISMEVLSGWLFYSYVGGRVSADMADGGSYWCYKGFYEFQDALFKYYKIYDDIRWVLCKPPKIEICNSTAYDLELNTDDVEYSAVINPDAKEDLEIDTICGTSGGIRPTARGGYYDSYTEEEISTFWRAGLSGTCEELYIATAFSQFAERHTTLQGEAVLDPMFNVYTEQNQGDLMFVATSVTEDVIMDTMDVTVVELSEDNYEPQE